MYKIKLCQIFTVTGSQVSLEMLDTGSELEGGSMNVLDSEMLHSPVLSTFQSVLQCEHSGGTALSAPSVE